MASSRQRAAARENAKKAQKARRAAPARASSRTSSRAGSRSTAHAQPPSRKRTKPAAKRAGGFFHVEVRSRTGFTAFRTQDVGEKGGIERVAGKGASGSWSTLKWLIGKEHAHVEGKTLVADTQDAKRLLTRMGSAPVRVRGDRFEVKGGRSASAKDKPAQKRSRGRAVKKAPAAKRKRATA